MTCGVGGVVVDVLSCVLNAAASHTSMVGVGCRGLRAAHDETAPSPVVEVDVWLWGRRRCSCPTTANDGTAPPLSVEVGAVGSAAW